MKTLNRIGFIIGAVMVLWIGYVIVTGIAEGISNAINSAAQVE